MDMDADRIEHPFAIRVARVAAAPQAPAGDFARVYELAEVRRRRMTGPARIPESVWEDMHRASQLCDDLAARGQQVRFDTHRVDGGVVASLCDREGTVLRRIGVSELIGVDPDPDTAA